MSSRHLINYKATSDVFETRHKLWGSKWCIRLTL